MSIILKQQLEAVSLRWYRLKVLKRQALCWLLLLLPTVILAMCLPEHLPLQIRMLILVVVTFLGTLLARWKVSAPSAVDAARLIEKKHPELNDTVLTAVQTSLQSDSDRSSVLERRTIQQADELARESNWSSVIPGRQLLLWTFVSLLSFCVFLSGVIAARNWKPVLVSVVKESAEESDGPVDVEEVAASLVVEPGDVEVERGSALTVVARFQGSVPAASRCRLTMGSDSALIPLEATVDKGVFATRIPAVLQDTEYAIEFAATAEEGAKLDSSSWPGQSESFQISTYVLPDLVQVDAVVRPPAYTLLPETKIDDTLRVTAVEGSMIDLALTANKPLSIVELRSSSGEVLPTTIREVSGEIDAVSELRAGERPDSELSASELATGEEDFSVYGCVLKAVQSDRFEVYLEDKAGRVAREAQTIILKVTRNNRPKIKVTFPGKDTNVSPLQEVLLEAEVVDDFGLLDYGIQYSLSSGESSEMSLKPDAGAASGSSVSASFGSGSSVSGQAAKLEEANSVERGMADEQPVTRTLMNHTVDLESLNAQPDQLLSYSFYVVDAASDGSPRTTFGDILFAEVRRYEDIFREAEQQGQQSQQQQKQQQQQGAGAAAELMKLQREIIIATWNVQRDLRDAKSSERALENAVRDGEVIRDSQRQAILQLDEAMAEMQDTELLKIASEVQEIMQQTEQALSEFAADPNIKKLTATRTLEQQAFAGLMKMRAKETQIQQSQSQSSSSSSSSSSSKQQMQQLELDNERQRYESERQAAEQKQQQQQAALQVLNRLKELARRQAMLNDQIKELESELRSATTEKEKEDLERELKRLREEQRELLRDADEASQQMQEQSQSAQQNSQQTPKQQQQSQQQLQQAREQMKRTSEALQKGDLQKAISEGTRAERQFDQLQEDFRQQISSQFSEAMQDLKQQAQDLQKKQKEMARELVGDQAGENSSQKSSDEKDGSQKARPSLKAERDKNGIAQKIEEQKDRLERILDEAEQVVKAAEESEPLLSRRLYDTLRDSKKERTVDALEATQVLMDRGLWNQSQKTEQVAREGIDQLTEGIERAAEAILGSEQESLRRAERTVQELAKELQQEIDQKAGGRPSGQQDYKEGQSNPLQSEASKSGSAQQQEGQQQDSKPAQPAGGQQPGTGRQEKEGQTESKSEQAQNRSAEAKQGQDGKAQQGGNSPGEQSSGQSNPEQQSSPSGQSGSGQSPSEQGSSPSERSSPGERSQSQPSGGRQGSRNQSMLLSGGRESNGGSASQNSAPLTGDDYRDWSNRLREVEEILNDDELRNQAARVRDRARSIRAEFRRHGKEPEWDLVQSELLDDMLDLQRRIQQQLSGLKSERSLAPIDREPVPEAYDELVRRYYELLGQSRQRSNPE